MTVIDKTYAPLRTNFDMVVCRLFDGVPLTAEHMKSLEAMFMAGAAAAYELMTSGDERRETLFNELLDHADHLEREGR